MLNLMRMNLFSVLKDVAESSTGKPLRSMPKHAKLCLCRKGSNSTHRPRGSLLRSRPKFSSKTRRIPTRVKWGWIKLEITGKQPLKISEQLLKLSKRMILNKTKKAFISMNNKDKRKSKEVTSTLFHANIARNFSQKFFSKNIKIIVSRRKKLRERRKLWPRKNEYHTSSTMILKFIIF